VISTAPTPDPSLEQVIIVDRHNREKGTASRRRMRSQRLIHRATYIMVFNPFGEILVQKRTTSKDIYPGMLEIAAGGVVSAGESYESSALRELEEETGITGVAIEEHFDFYFEDETNRLWGRLFSCTHDGELKFQEEEVEWGRFFPILKLEEEIKRGDFTPDSLYLLEECKKKGLFFSHE